MVTLIPHSTKGSSQNLESLPSCSHSFIVHLVANLHSFFNTVYHSSNSLLFAATHALSVCTIFHDSSVFCFSFCVYNIMLGSGQFDRGECMSTTIWSDFDSIALSEVYGFVIILCIQSIAKIRYL